MENMRRIVIIGATSYIAQSCARLWLQKRQVNLILIGRDKERIERVAADLKVRSPQSIIQTIETDFFDIFAISKTISEVFKLGRIDLVLIAQGYLPSQSECQNNLQACKETIEINGVSPILYAEAIAMEMEGANYGTIALIGSVAGDRGRKSNYTYGAAKGLLDRYSQGLQHRFADTGVKVVLIKPGPTDTPMTVHLKGKGKSINLAPVEDVAKQIVNDIEAGKSIIYTPKKWRLIMQIIIHLPNFIIHKLNI